MITKTSRLKKYSKRAQIKIMFTPGLLNNAVNNENSVLVVEVSSRPDEESKIMFSQDEYESALEDGYRGAKGYDIITSKIELCSEK